MGTGTGETGTARVTAAPFGTLPSGDAVTGYSLVNASGLALHAIEYGGIITSLSTPDRDGALADIVLGHDRLDGYRPNPAYLGAIIGRVANRLRDARFTLDGATHHVTANVPPHALHGGARGFDQRLWRGRAHADADGAHVTFRLESPDGDQGYPGVLSVAVSYALTNGNALVIEYEATTTKPTPVDLTHHAYFNLAGHDAGTVSDHVVAIAADWYLPIDDARLSTGAIESVTNTPFDLRAPVRIGSRIDGAHPQLRIGGGYDHHWVINGAAGTPRQAARVVERRSGRTLDVTTTAPGMQFYTGNALDGSIRGKAGAPYAHRGGLSFETQHGPDAPNPLALPSVILRPGQTFRSRTTFAFGVER